MAPRIDHLARFADVRPVYRGALKRFFAETEGDPARLRRRDFVLARDALARKYAPATVAEACSAARAFYDWLLDLEVVDTNPGYRVKVKRVDNVPMWNVLTSSAEVERLLKAPDTARDRAVVACLVLQGWRVTSFCRMTWGDVRETDDGPGVTSVLKFGKRAFHLLEPRVLRAVHAWVPAELRRGATPLVPLRLDPPTPLNRNTAWRIVKRWTAEVGSKASPHGLRATAISGWIRAVGIEYARQRADQSQIVTTQRYSRWAPVKLTKGTSA